MRQLSVFIFLTLLSLKISVAQVITYERTIHWETLRYVQRSEDEQMPLLGFEGADYSYPGALPLYSENFKITSGIISNYTVELSNKKFEAFSPAEANYLGKHSGNISTTLKISSSLAKSRHQHLASLRFIPIRFNAALDRYEKLVSFTAEIVYEKHAQEQPAAHSLKRKESSVLASGNWYKIGVTQSGIHKITQADLNAMGIDVASTDPQNIRIYGNRGGMLPEENNRFRHNDPVEHAIYIQGENDGSFDNNDYILFYAEGPHAWKYSTYHQKFIHNVHRYSDTNYYYVNTGLGKGKRIQTLSTSGEEADHIITQFHDRAAHEKEDHNLIGSGREWYGEVFDIQTQYDFEFEFPNLIKNKGVFARFEAAARSTASSSFSFSFNGTEESFSIFPISNYYNADYAKSGDDTLTFYPGTNTVNATVTYYRSVSGSAGWLNFIELNAWRKLAFTGGQMNFRDYTSLEEPAISEFRVTNTTPSVKIWDVTDPFNVRNINANHTSNTITFRMATDTLHEFVAHDGSEYLQTHFVEQIENQNLHALAPPDYLIIAHPLFFDQAFRLASFHVQHSELEVEVVSPQHIYNEFSSGTRDISAIRDFIKLLYDKDESKEKFRYVLFFGDGSYDNKNRVEENTNFIPTWQSGNSLNPVNSYVTDDFYAYLDENEGDGLDDLVDLGTGRLPVFNVEQAEQQVDKIIHYASSSQHVMGDWRNMICFVADDEEGNIHMSQADELARYINNNYPEYNIDKIYFDAYKQVSTPGGQRYPEASDAINNRVRKGALFLNYTGHGGEVGWAHERVLEIADINSWNNYDQMPVFVTATCEFSRFDDPRRTSAGELVLLNEKGGGIALFTTTRATYGSPNLSLNKRLYENAFKRTNGEFPKMGDLIYISKVLDGGGNNGKKFILLGDPALQIAYPEYRVQTTAINNKPAGEIPDTIKALSEVSVMGEIRNSNGNKMTGFNGVVHPSVYDKVVTVTTQSNDGGSPMNFSLRKNIIYRGKAEVVSGEFEFKFIVPKDIAYKFGNGKISYYASNGIKDANGSYENITIGGYDENSIIDNEGPIIELFINDTNFVAGGITDENPVLLAFVSDSSGINTIGSGIGHDISAYIDDKTDETKVLNEFYEADLNTYKSGTVRYPFSELEEGAHTLTFKVWDVNNNSAEKTINFVVAGSEEFALEQVMNYPNPFKNYTNFTFEHNQPGNAMEVKVQIFSMSGELMKTITRTIAGEGYRAEPIRWNGTGDNGNYLKRGMYIYRISVEREDGKRVQKTSKLVILK